MGYLYLVQDVLERILLRPRHLDTMIYPLVANWRHYVELRLKLICFALADLREDDERVHATHDLRWLWNRVRGFLVRQFPDEAVEQLACLDEHVEHLAAIDPNSMVFRYTIDKEGRASLPEDLEYIGYVEFAQAVEEVSLTLESVLTHVKHVTDYVAEARAEEAAEYARYCYY